MLPGGHLRFRDRNSMRHPLAAAARGAARCALRHFVVRGIVSFHGERYLARGFDDAGKGSFPIHHFL